MKTQNWKQNVQVKDSDTKKIPNKTTWEKKRKSKSTKI